MKEIVKDSFKKLVADRYLLMLISALLLLALVFAVVIGLSIHPSEMQLISHYSSFGVSHYYRDQWFYLLVFVAFELIAASLHAVISTKLLVLKGRSLAIMFAWYGVAIIILGNVTALAVINAWIP
jgi:hypothetical protein